MQVKPETYLLYALRHLKKFSLPGVGTFSRAWHPAEIDFQNEIILPPGERLTFSPDQSGAGNLEQFFFSKLKVSMSKAKALVDKLAGYVADQLRNQKEYEIPGYGLLKLGLDQQPGFIETEGRKIAEGYGLQPVKYIKPKPVLQATEKSEEKPAKQQAKDDAIPVREMKRDKKKHKKKREGKKSKGKLLIPVLLIVLILALGVGGYLFRNELSQWYTEMTTGGTDQPELPDKPEPEPKPEPETQHEPQPEVQPEPESQSGNGTQEKPEVQAQHAEAGKYYLVVSSTKNEASARAYAAELKQQGYDAEVIAPNGGSGWYKVSIYASDKKQPVIDKMIETKNKFKEPSWIWSGE